MFFFLLLLSGDIEPNPGPTSCTFNFYTLNIKSLTNHVHYTALLYIAETHRIHIFVLTETWIPPFTTSAKLFDSVRIGFSLLSFPRPDIPNNKDKIIGGGAAFLRKLSPVLLLFLNHLKYPLSLLNFLNLD
jgi:hypothetical protein